MKDLELCEITQDIDLSIILAAFGEADNLRWLLPRIQSVVNKLVTKSEILVIDAELPIDDTLAVCVEFGVGCIPRQGGNDYGNAIKTGIAASAGHHVIIMDADGSHNPEFIKVLWSHKDDADVVIASRYITGGSTDNPFILVFISRILNLVYRLVLKMPVYDLSNSFRLYSGELLRSLSLFCSHYEIQEEILFKLLCDRTKLVRALEVSFQFSQRKFGKSKRNLIIFGVQFLLTMYRLYRLKHRSNTQLPNLTKTEVNPRLVRKT
jgi:dolichol-phosphate mannosyltransferase